MRVRSMKMWGGFLIRSRWASIAKALFAPHHMRIWRARISLRRGVDGGVGGLSMLGGLWVGEEVREEGSCECQD